MVPSDNELTLIKEIPDFKPDIDELTLSKLGPGERLLAIELSKIRQEIRWSSTTSMNAYNISVENRLIINKWRRLYESPLTFSFWLLGVIVVAVLGALATRLFNGGK